jgi:colanic acid biosynthesis glycosyl transferase WcaI
MGWAQDMMAIVRCAERLQEPSDILFLLVGNGLEKQGAMEYAEQQGLRNIKWLPMQPFDVYLQILAASDVSMLNLNGDLTTPVVPSKIKNIMASGRPVVASLPLEGDAPQIVREAQCGYCVGAGDAEGLAAAILQLYRDPGEAERLGQNGRRYAEAHFARDICVGQYETLFASLVQKGQ